MNKRRIFFRGKDQSQEGNQAQQYPLDAAKEQSQDANFKR
jgi:hypothetical protein